jgi:hypothetical protein
MFLGIFLKEETTYMGGYYFPAIHISGYFVYSLGGICTFMFLCSLVLYRLTRSTEGALNYMTGVSIYLNAISLAVVMIMLISPAVHINWKPMVCDYLNKHVENETFIKQCFSDLKQLN